jgi:transcription antitermination factor NusG
MDFFQFLEKEKSKPTEQPTNTEEIKQVYKKFKKGDFVKIVRVKDSLLNHYKGYIGEIREYRTNQDFAIVFLHAINAVTYIKFPLEHLEEIAD